MMRKIDTPLPVLRKAYAAGIKNINIPRCNGSQGLGLVASAAVSIMAMRHRRNVRIVSFPQPAFKQKD
jgi:hypothetical protein